MACFSKLCYPVGFIAIACFLMGTGGAVHNPLETALAKHEITAVFIGEISASEMRRISGARPVDSDIADYEQYSLVEVDYSALADQQIYGDLQKGKLVQMTYIENTGSHMIKIQPDGTHETVFSVMGFLSTGSGAESGNQLGMPGSRGVFVLGRPQGQKDIRLLRVEKAGTESVDQIKQYIEKAS
jgi:hypothetical protein